MEKIVSNLHNPTPDLSMLAEIIEQLDETGIMCEAVCNIIDEQLYYHADDLMGKAARALRESAKALIDGDIAASEKYRGIAEGLCYALECAIGLPFDTAFLSALVHAKKI